VVNREIRAPDPGITVGVEFVAGQGLGHFLDAASSSVIGSQ